MKGVQELKKTYKRKERGRENGNANKALSGFDKSYL